MARVSLPLTPFLSCVLPVSKEERCRQDSEEPRGQKARPTGCTQRCFFVVLRRLSCRRHPILRCRPRRQFPLVHFRSASRHHCRPRSLLPRSSGALQAARLLYGREERTRAAALTCRSPPSARLVA
ncbi:hypothetical protein MTO96_001127 [Rhipicephalus appendiculatus]